MKSDLKAYYIPKPGKKGSYRKITTYKTMDCDLYRFHQNANISLQKYLIHSDFAKAYIKGRSIITNARAHLYNDIFVSLDIENFFPSIQLGRLSEILFYELNRKSIQRFTKAQCTELVYSCSNSKKGIAIGLKPSPILANIYLKEFDGILYGRIKNMGLDNPIYTRYADDIVISYRQSVESQLDIERINIQIISMVRELLKRYGLELNKKKKRIVNLSVSNHVRITGINISKDVNNYRKLTVGRKTKNELYYQAINLLKGKNPASDNFILKKRLKGLQSFILSVEGPDYQNTYSNTMKSVFTEKGYKTIKDYIDSL